MRKKVKAQKDYQVLYKILEEEEKIIKNLAENPEQVLRDIFTME